MIKQMQRFVLLSSVLLSSSVGIYAEQIQAILVDGCTTPGTALNSTCSVTVPWPAAFIDTNYLVTCSPTGTSYYEVNQSVQFFGYSLEVPFSANTTTTSTVVVRNLAPQSSTLVGQIQCIGVRP